MSSSTGKGARVDEDLEQLFRRIAFNVAVRNTDDHLRNHGFLLTESGWHLSPAFDINPNPRKLGLTLNIDENNNALDLNLAASIPQYFRLEKDKANNIIEEVCASVAQFEKLAVELGIPTAEIDQLRVCFTTHFSP